MLFQSFKQYHNLITISHKGRELCIEVILKWVALYYIFNESI